MPQFRRIASNLLWTPQGLVRHPFIVLADDGSLHSVASCSEPDRVAFAEFRAGLVVLDFPMDFRGAFGRFLAGPPLSLAEWLPRVVVPGHGIPVVISGIDYSTLQAAPSARIERL